AEALSSRLPHGDTSPWKLTHRYHVHREKTVLDIPDQHGRTVVVTGATSGIGFVTARLLAHAGARTVLAVRDTARGAEAAERIRAAAPDADVVVLPLDLADLASVRKFAGLLPEHCDGLDVLVNNAGVMAIPHR